MPNNDISKTKLRFEFKQCDTCGRPGSAFRRFWNGKNECSECAGKSFRAYYITIGVGGGIVAMLLYAGII